MSINFDFDFSKITGKSVVRSAPSRIIRKQSTFNKSRFIPYNPPSNENIKDAIKNLEILIRTFYTNAFYSFKYEIYLIIDILNELVKTFNNEEKSDFNELTLILKNKTVTVPDKLQRIGIVLGTQGTQDRLIQIPNYNKALLLLIIIYILNVLVINPEIILSELSELRKHTKDEKYLKELFKYYNKKQQPYFRMLNIRGVYIYNMNYEKLTDYSRFLFDYTTTKHNNTDDTDALDKFLVTIEKRIKIEPYYYKRYEDPEYKRGEKSGGRGIKSNCVMKDIKELCKANKIKLSRIIDGKRVIYKKKELITKLKRKKIRIPKSLH